jgi:hypothetical protein
VECSGVNHSQRIQALGGGGQDRGLIDMRDDRDTGKKDRRTDKKAEIG